MKVTELFSQKIECDINGNHDVDITGIAYDSRKVKKDDLFVCLVGAEVDGHNYINQAIEAGASAILLESLPEQLEASVCYIQVEDTRKALALVSAEFFGHPEEQLTLVGITGTKGKTTIAHLIRGILREAGFKVGMIGSLGAFIEDEQFETKNTTPESYELWNLFSQMLQAGCKYVVMEVSSQALKLHRTYGLQFDYGLFLNMSPDHIGPGEHESFEEYFECKQLLFPQTKKVIYNKDDKLWEGFFEDKKDVISFSCEKEATIMGSQIYNKWEEGFLGLTFQVSGLVNGTIDMNMPGTFSAQNAMAALGVAHEEGISFSICYEALRKAYVKGHMEVVQSAAKRSTVVLDYAHNSLSMEALMQTLKSYQPKRLICMFGCGGHKPKQRRYDMGLAAGKYADLIVLTTDNRRFEPLEEINASIIEGINVHGAPYVCIDDRTDAIHYCLDHCDKDDIVVFAGKGHEEYLDILGEHFFYSEKQVIDEYMRQQ